MIRPDSIYIYICDKHPIREIKKILASSSIRWSGAKEDLLCWLASPHNIKPIEGLRHQQGILMRDRSPCVTIRRQKRCHAAVPLFFIYIHLSVEKKHLYRLVCGALGRSNHPSIRRRLLAGTSIDPSLHTAI